jgi:hypothetical protein
MFVIFMKLILPNVNDVQVESNRAVVSWILTDGFVVDR